MKKLKTLLLTVALISMGSIATAQDIDGYKIKAVNDAKTLMSNTTVVNAIKDQNTAHAGYDEAKIIKLDKVWRAEIASGALDMVNDLLQNPTSVELNRTKDASTGAYGEIFIMDNKGLNVAASDATSDYWQGDEAKWKKTFLLGADAVHVSEVDFDESVQAFTAQISTALTDPESGEVIGAITFGIIME